MAYTTVTRFPQRNARPRVVRYPAPPRALRGMGSLRVYIDPQTGARVSGDATAPGGNVTPYVVPPVPGFSYPEGSLLKANDLPAGTFNADAVFIIQGGQRHWIPDQTTLFALGFTWAQVEGVPSAQLLRIPLGATIPSAVAKASASSNAYPDGAILRANDGSSNTYIIQNGQRRLIPDDATIYDLGYSDASIELVPASALNVIPLGAPVPSGSSSLTTAQTTTSSNYQPTFQAPPSAAPIAPSPSGNYISTAPVATAATSSFDISSFSTWPTWLWLALGVGVGAIALFKHK